MARTLILLRHAKAGSKSGPDKARVLAEKGRIQAGVMGNLLREEVGRVDLALVSGAERTRETATLLSPALDIGDVEVLDELYEAGIEEVLAAVREVPGDARTVLVVGHEPTISQTARHLHDAANDDIAADLRLGVTTGTACIVDVPGPWAELDQGEGHVRALLSP